MISETTLKILASPRMRELRAAIEDTNQPVAICGKYIARGHVGDVETAKAFFQDQTDAEDIYLMALCQALIDAGEPPYRFRQTGRPMLDWQLEINAGFASHGHPPAFME